MVLLTAVKYQFHPFTMNLPKQQPRAGFEEGVFFNFFPNSIPYNVVFTVFDSTTTATPVTLPAPAAAAAATTKPFSEQPTFFAAAAATTVSSTTATTAAAATASFVSFHE